MGNLPKISILVAARNEADNIVACLSALDQLDYPKELLEIWLGNDASTDETEALARSFSQGKPHFHIVNILPATGQAKGKANVLAQLAKLATGDVFLITDADVRVPKSWAKAMIAQWKPGVGLATGFTLVAGKSLMANLQALDWALALSLIKLATDAGVPPTAMGNNMLVSTAAYWQTGGYEKIPFSITEDFALFQAIQSKGWRIGMAISKDVMAFTKEARTLPELLHQRKRWMRGALQAPWYLLLPLAVQPLLLPFLLALAFINPLAALGIWSARFLLKSTALTWRLGRLGQWRPLLYLPLHEIYEPIFLFILPIFYALPIAVRWKGRSYFSS